MRALIILAALSVLALSSPEASARCVMSYCTGDTTATSTPAPSTPMCLFVTLAKPTAPMKKEAASAGVLDTPFGKFAPVSMLDLELRWIKLSHNFSPSLC